VARASLGCGISLLFKQTRVIDVMTAQSVAKENDYDDVYD
jgi:hypothetical protein